MKIIFVVTSLMMGGAEKLAIQYINRLSKDFEILLLVREDAGVENTLERYIPENVEKRFVIPEGLSKNVSKYRKGRRHNILYKCLYNYYLKKRRKSFQKNIKEILKNEKYDVLIDFMNKVPNELRDERSIVWLQTNVSKITNESKRQKFEEQVSKLGKIIVLTERMKKQCREQIEDENTKLKIECLYNLFDISKIQSLAKDDSTLSQIERELQKEKYILAVARLDKNKDLSTLIRAYSKIANEVEEKLYIIGSGSEEENLKAIVKKLKLNQKVIFLGYQRNPYIWMQKANLFVHSSKSEGFGMVLVEAMINHTAVVTTDCPVGPREILKDGEYGILVKNGDYKGMASSIKQMLSNPELRSDYIKKAERRVEDFSMTKIYSQLKTILKEIGEKNE